MINIICPNCKEVLNEHDREFVCTNNHHFDKAKSGYLNLLLNHPDSGDNKIMVDARKVILNSGYFQGLLDGITEVLKDYKLESLLDLGCGEGYYSRNIKGIFDIDVYGVDISKVAINIAAKQNKEVLYLVSNIYNLPFRDNSIDAIINIFAPHSEEIRRVVKSLYIKVVPGPMHLIELKKAMYDDVYIKEDSNLVLNGLNLVYEKNINYQVYIKEINELLMMTPYYYKTKIKDLNLPSMDITMDFKIMVYHK